jgi:hypothetical protein
MSRHDASPVAIPNPELSFPDALDRNLRENNERGRKGADRKRSPDGAFWVPFFALFVFLG